MSIDIQVQLVCRVVIEVTSAGSSAGDSDFNVYSDWLQLDGGNPFSVYSEQDSVFGGVP